MENEVKNRLINYIYSTVKKLNINEFDIDTNMGKIIKIYEYNIVIDEFSNGQVLTFNYLTGCKITTLYQIVERLKCEVEYDIIVEKLKTKNDFWDKEKLIWTYKPINKNVLMGKIKIRIRNGKTKRYVARITKKN